MSLKVPFKYNGEIHRKETPELVGPGDLSLFYPFYSQVFF